MAQPLTLPPPGFEALTLDEKIEYLEELWDSLAHEPVSLPIPEWHRDLARERMAFYRDNPKAVREWSEVRDEILTHLSERAAKR
jgi:putative addiction module component (TIGR02574 family)